MLLAKWNFQFHGDCHDVGAGHLVGWFESVIVEKAGKSVASLFIFGQMRWVAAASRPVAEYLFQLGGFDRAVLGKVCGVVVAGLAGLFHMTAI